MRRPGASCAALPPVVAGALSRAPASGAPLRAPGTGRQRIEGSMLISPAFAQATGAGAAGSGALAAFVSFAPLILIALVFWLIILRPQQKRQRDHAAAIAAVRKGDQIVTAGGLMGRVTRVEDAVVEVEVAANTRVRVVKSTLAEVQGTGGAKPAND